VFYAIVVIGTVGGMVLSLLGFDPIRLLVFVAIVNGVAAAPFLVIVMLVSSDRAIMGEHANKRLALVLGWTATALMAAAAVALFATGGGL
jgi:Mn2+/Fe2+ NRAMP family transporter